MAMKRTMLAAQLQAPGEPSALKLVQLPIPTPEPGQVLIRVKAFGLNRAELLARRFGRAPVGPVALPRVLGVEATGLIESAPGNENEFPKGAVAMAALGSMGRLIDGGYAQYTCVPVENVAVLQSTTAAEKLGWTVLGALPVLLQTAHGSLSRSLKLQSGDTLLIRGGTTGVGLAAASIAHLAGAEVLATTRKTDEKTAALLRKNGASYVIVDDGRSLSALVKQIKSHGVHKVLELTGGSTLLDSLACLAPEGICCFTGLVAGSPIVPDFNPLAAIATGRYLTAYAERSFGAANLPLDEIVGQIEAGDLSVHVGRVFQLEQIVEAHECMEVNESNGKVVVLTGM